MVRLGEKSFSSKGVFAVLKMSKFKILMLLVIEIVLDVCCSMIQTNLVFTKSRITIDLVILLLFAIEKSFSRTYFVTLLSKYIKSI